ncbi:MAG: hypothetical protein V7637_6268 [Mycobacteriales bacterium]|jgi:hypothetical protein
MSWRQLPGPAREIGAAAGEAVAAARAVEPDGFATACARLGALDSARVRRVLGTVVRALLEDLHPDGLTGDDLQIVLERCAVAARPWWPAVDPVTLAVLLVGALGVQSEEDEPPAGDITAHAALLVADLLTARGAALDGYLDRAFRDIAYAEADGP